MKKFLIVFLPTFLCLFNSCNLNADKETVDQTSAMQLGDISNFIAAFFSFSETYNRLPDSIEEIITYCQTNPDLQSRDIDWSGFTFQKINQDQVEILYKNQDYSIPITIDTSTRSVDTSDYLEKHIQDKLQELIKSHNEEEISKVIQCLHEFIRNNKQDQRFISEGIELNEDLITVGNVVAEREDKWKINGWLFCKYDYPKDENEKIIWQFGNWTGGSQWYIVASTYYDIIGGHLTGVFVRIEKSNENSYQVTDLSIIDMLCSDIE